MDIPQDWSSVLTEEINDDRFLELQKFLGAERESHVIYPPEQEIFSFLELTPYEQVSVLILGQDPYHGEGQAHGLSFSVKPGIKTPPSLRNIYQELQNDVGARIPSHGHLKSWATQGVLMLNAVLTVKAHCPNSHKNKGWEDFTDAIIRKVNEKESPVAFVLWGTYAQRKLNLIDTQRHKVIQSAHPSPLSAHKGFWGSKPFSQVNHFLRESGKPEIDWQISDP